MRQVAVSPERLRNAQEQAQRGGEQAVHPGGSKEGPMDEIVGNVLAFHQTPSAMTGASGQTMQHRAVQGGERHQNGVAAGEPPDFRPRAIPCDGCHGVQRSL